MSPLDPVSNFALLPYFINYIFHGVQQDKLTQGSLLLQADTLTRVCRSAPKKCANE